MCLEAPTSPNLAALSPTRFWRGWLIWRRIILRLLATQDANNLSYEKPLLEMAAKRKHLLTRARSRVSASRRNEITQTLLEKRHAPTPKVQLDLAVQPILLAPMKRSHPRINQR
jgi:hypothetical protein